MYVKIPFESTIEFKSNIAEITKMSLEHDYNVSDGLVLGNFYISGEYRPHEVSINTEPFKYTLPFTVELREDIERDSLEFNIEDFSYDIVDKNNLKVNIEYSLKGEERVKEEIEENKEDELFERVNEDELNSELEFIDEFLSQEEISKNEEEVKEEEKNEEVKEEVKEEKDTEEKEDAERISEESEKTIMDTIKDSDDTFVTYNVHIVKESETLESIATFYKVPSSLISEYNNIDTLAIGDKVIIPSLDE